MTIPSAEDVAKEILATASELGFLLVKLENVERLIRADRSRLIEWLRERMPKKMDCWHASISEKNHQLVNCICSRNEAIEAFEKLLGEVEG